MKARKKEKEEEMEYEKNNDYKAILQAWTNEVEEAIKRWKEGTYGYYLKERWESGPKCGNEISEGNLEFLLEAQCCVECKEH